MPKVTTPRDLLIEELKDLYSAETQLTKSLPRLAKAVDSEALRELFNGHLETTKQQIERLDEIFAQLDVTPRGRKSVAMEGLIQESKEILEMDAEPVIKDLALIVAAQKVEHYEIAGYGSARTLAELLGEKKLVKSLQQTLEEESKTDKNLTEVALALNLEAGVMAEAEA